MSFKDRLLETIKRLLTSAKVITTITGGIVYIAAKHHIILSPDDVQSILLLFSVLVGAQGLTDFNKSAATIHAEVKAKETVPETPKQTLNVDITTTPKQGEQE